MPPYHPPFLLLSVIIPIFATIIPILLVSPPFCRLPSPEYRPGRSTAAPPLPTLCLAPRYATVGGLSVYLQTDRHNSIMTIACIARSISGRIWKKIWQSMSLKLFSLSSCKLFINSWTSMLNYSFVRGTRFSFTCTGTPPSGGRAAWRGVVYVDDASQNKTKKNLLTEISILLVLTI